MDGLYENIIQNAVRDLGLQGIDFSPDCIGIEMTKRGYRFLSTLEMTDAVLSFRTQGILVSKKQISRYARNDKEGDRNSK
jgi:hypothetical protein